MGFMAKIHQPCAECGATLKGHLVHHEGEELVHDECPETQIDKDMKAKVCEDCWLIHPEGACLA
ncbi:hypothetical protein SEA_RIKSENGUPTA_62 [Microbacterium phage RikSengupta]|nr:hypothetical protein SEA_SPARCETUS_62 [Microbacterium phage Sparcetus]WMI33158.1 hypothetical protein SEA_RIKSENGUPTA_62 [Microbacterium phage RikSengupta]